MENEYVQLISREVRETNWPRARLLTSEEQEKYNEFVKNFKSERAKNILNVQSNLFKILGLNQIGIRTATLPELDLIVANNPNFLEGYY